MISYLSNARQPTEDERWDYHDQAVQERFEREQAKNWRENNRHPHDPDYVAPETEDETE